MHINSETKIYVQKNYINHMNCFKKLYFIQFFILNFIASKSKHKVIINLSSMIENYISSIWISEISNENFIKLSVFRKVLLNLLFKNLTLLPKFISKLKISLGFLTWLVLKLSEEKTLNESIYDHFESKKIVEMSKFPVKVSN